MSTLSSRALDMLKAAYVKKHGAIHPAVEALPAEVQLDLLKQAEAGDVALDEKSIAAFTSEVDRRFDVLLKIAPMFQKGGVA